MGGSALPEVDVVVPRIGASITNYGLAVVRQFDLMGVPVLNGASSIARSRDKLRSLQLLAHEGLDVPTTVCARSPAGLDSALELVGGAPAIVKLQQGTQGIGTMIADTTQAAHALLETFWAMGQDIVLQEYVRESKGRDVRIIVIGGEVVAAMRRVAKRGEFRANLHRGGSAVSLKLPKSYRTMATRATEVMGLEIAGVDVLEGRRGPRILEINSSPGLEGIERTTGVDVAGAIIDHAEACVRRARARARAAARAGRDSLPPPARKPRATASKKATRA
jgi:ribosomal protein S6--L-glutamate ligase